MNTESESFTASRMTMLTVHTADNRSRYNQHCASVYSRSLLPNQKNTSFAVENVPVIRQRARASTMNVLLIKSTVERVNATSRHVLEP